MLVLRTGNLFNSGCEAIVNPVNSNGIIGPGIAKEMNLLYPETYPAYYKACKQNELSPGIILPTKTLHQIPKWILNFATRADSRSNSKIEWIDQGLCNLKLESEKLKLKLVAIPPLYLEKDNFTWSDVYKLMYKNLSDPGIKYFVYLPR